MDENTLFIFELIGGARVELTFVLKYFCFSFDFDEMLLDCSNWTVENFQKFSFKLRDPVKRTEDSIIIIVINSNKFNKIVLTGFKTFLIKYVFKPAMRNASSRFSPNAGSISNSPDKNSSVFSDI